MGDGTANIERAIQRRSTTSTAAFVQATQADAATRSCPARLNPKGKIRECRDSPAHPRANGIVIAMDGTASRGDDAGIVYQNLPRFFDVVLRHELVDHPQIMVAVIGDATFDRAPVQIGQWESSDVPLDEDLSTILVEKGGGGTGQESYELFAFFMARRTELDCLKRNEKATLFMLGDEGFYPTVSREQVRRVLGVDIPEDIPSEEIFAELQRRFDVFLILPATSLEDRIAGIDEEMRQRIRERGGKVDGVDVQIGLAWSTYDDLDLHVVTPGGETIFYSNKRSTCGGELDVDMNAACRNNMSLKPVENIRWAKGCAPRGNYKVYIDTYQRYEEGQPLPEYKVQVNNGGTFETFEGKANPRGRKKLVGEFFFDPSKESQAGQSGRYENYDPKKIRAQWATVLPPENILAVTSPACAIDLMVGVMGLRSGKLSLDEVDAIAKKAGASAAHRKDVREALSGFADLRGAAKAPAGLFKKKKKAGV